MKGTLEQHLVCFIEAGNESKNGSLSTKGRLIEKEMKKRHEKTKKNCLEDLKWNGIFLKK